MSALKFWTMHQRVADDKTIHPVPIKKSIPDWFKDLKPGGVPGHEPHDLKSYAKPTITAKTCPGIRDYLTAGVMLPMWCDLAFEDIEPEEGKEEREVGVYLPHEVFTVSWHPADQLGKQCPMHTGHSSYPKLDSPWYVETPPGWSILVLPVWFHETDEDPVFRVLPGIVDTDVLHQINLPGQFFPRKKRFSSLKKGQPLAHIIPFERQSVDLEVGLMSEEDRQRLNPPVSLFKGDYSYQQRMRDSKLAEG